MGTKVILKVLSMPEASPPTKPRLACKVRGWLEEIESNTDSEHAWNMVRLLFNKLSRLKSRTRSQEELFKLVAPVVERFGQHDIRGVDIKAENLSIVRGTSPMEDDNGND